jgi:cyclophilin family peptidyl-prolyl cis-trans isomerase
MFFFRRFTLAAIVFAAPLALRAQSTVPTLTQAIPAQTLSATGGPVSLDLSKYFSIPGVTGQVAQVKTTLGTFNVELLASAAPKNVANFLNYVNRGAYANNLFHRSVPGFIIQSGGFTLSGTSLAVVPADSPVQNEFSLSNVRGTLAMAKVAPPSAGGPANGGPDSATSQWFVNLADNSANLDNQNGGFTVFARVLGTGMTVVDSIAAVPVYDVSSQLGGDFSALPLLNASLTPSNVILVQSIAVVPLYPTDNSGNAVLTFTPANNNSSVVSVAISGSTLTITPVGAGTATLSLRAADTNNSSISTTVTVTVAAANTAPAITVQPVSQNVATGSTAVFNVAATGVPTPTYQWQFNGSNIAGATGPRLVLPAGTAQAGTYSVVVSNSVSSVPSNNAALSFSNTADFGRLTNLSVLADLTADSSNFTVGTVIGGGAAGATKPLLVRAVGPSLARVGIASGFVADPTAQLFNSTSTSIATNDNWGTGDPSLAQIFAQVGAFGFTNTASKDSAIYSPALASGGYTVTVSGVGGVTGTVLAEIYDAAPSTVSPRLIDVSVLKQIAAGGSVTAGFHLAGSTSRTVLIRAIGPGLAALGVGGAMADPQVELFDGSSKKIFDNDNWGGDPQITAANSSVGAFAISNLASKDAIMLVTLTPGDYTARVSGVAGSSGLAVVEVYEVP